MNDFVWTDAAIEQLRIMRSEGQSYSIIGQALGVTRSAVAGKANRLGIVERVVRITKPKKRPNPGFSLRGGYDSRKVTPPRPARLEAVPTNPLPVLFEKLTRAMCKYPYGDRVPFLFCGKSAIEGKHWCVDHISIVFEPKRQRS